MTEDLSNIFDLIQKPALKVIMGKHFYVNEETQFLNDQGGIEHGHGMCYHPSGEWLNSHGNSATKGDSIEIYRLRDYLEWRGHQPMMILHELSHALHYHNHSALDTMIRQEYERAQQSGRYESVWYLKEGGEKKKHYAMTTHFEYFAECSEAYFGTNDYYPFVRDELAEFDP